MSAINRIANKTTNTAGLPAKRSRKEMLSKIEVRRQQIELLRQQSDLDDRNQNRKHREKYIDRLFWFMVASVLLAWLSVFLSGNSIGSLLIYVAPSVQIALHSTTTVEVIGLFVLVVKYMFK